jgi:hypothetical protein
MLNGYNQKFIEEIKKISINKNYDDDMKKEWKCCEIFIYSCEVDEAKASDDIDNYIKHKYNLNSNYKLKECICTHSINCHCVIENKITKLRLCIGNCCVRMLDELKYQINKKIFIKLAEMGKAKLTKPTKIMLTILFEKQLINEDDMNYCNSIRNIYRNNLIRLNVDDVLFILKMNQISINYFCNKNIIYDSIYIKNLIYKHGSTDLKFEYYEQYVKANPSDYSNTYTIDLDEKLEPYWKLVNKREDCSICDFGKRYDVNCIFDVYYESEKYKKGVNKTDFIVKHNDKKYCQNCFKNYHNGKYLYIEYNEQLFIIPKVVSKICELCNEDKIYKIMDIFKKIKKYNDISEKENIIIENNNFFIQNKCKDCFIKEFNKDVNIKYNIKFYLYKNKLYYDLQIDKINKICNNCGKQTFKCGNDNRKMCYSCLNDTCLKCNKELDYDSKEWVEYANTNNNKIYGVCKSCITNKEYNKFWDNQFNYGCSTCKGWNFRFKNDDKFKKEVCFKCFKKQKNKCTNNVLSNSVKFNTVKPVIEELIVESEPEPDIKPIVLNNNMDKAIIHNVEPIVLSSDRFNMVKPLKEKSILKMQCNKSYILQQKNKEIRSKNILSFLYKN